MLRRRPAVTGVPIWLLAIDGVIPLAGTRQTWWKLPAAQRVLAQGRPLAHQLVLTPPLAHQGEGRAATRSAAARRCVAAAVPGRPR